MTDVIDLRQSLYEHLDLLIDSGYTKPIVNVELKDIPHIVHCVALHKVVLQSLAELAQFKEGFSCLDVIGAFQNFHQFLKSYFCVEHAEITGINFFFLLYVPLAFYHCKAYYLITRIV